HNCGRSVIKLTFSSGLKLIYKPKDLGIDEAFFALIDWLNEAIGGVQAPDGVAAIRQMLPLRVLRRLRLLNRTTHGWVECVEHVPLPDAEAAERYYRRMGMLLCLAYVLGGSDCHYENIIACGAQPVLVDHETLFQSSMMPFDGLDLGSADSLAG